MMWFGEFTAGRGKHLAGPSAVFINGGSYKLDGSAQVWPW